ncbi:Down syndrome cell adhesion molecule-like protein 1 homolog [Mauremys mutica]|uniref:Down syndrome cell adhesion molecule-like protein 1 homolog n=1 Tax=Mauremys mutica TaxID=74926 RepID=UPI001D14AADA|nr:Down syndrome cell adhesion molecule-like protein 1 homolog [Mauremys mutica]
MAERIVKERVADMELRSLDILLSRHEQPSPFCLSHNWLGSVQEPQAEQKLTEVDPISLSILLSRHEQSFPFCLPLNLVWAPSEYGTSSEQVFYCIAHLTRRQQDVLWVVAVTLAGRSNISAKVTGKAQIIFFGGTITILWMKDVRLPCSAVGEPAPVMKWTKDR